MAALVAASGHGATAGSPLEATKSSDILLLATPSHGNTTSGAEQVAEWAHGAKVVKAFNTVGFNIRANLRF